MGANIVAASTATVGNTTRYCSEERIVHIVQKLMNGTLDYYIDPAIADFRLSTIPDEQVVKITEITGYTQQDREFEVAECLLRSIAKRRFLQNSDAVVVADATVQNWVRAVQAIAILKDATEAGSIRNRATEIIGTTLEDRYAQNGTIGDNLCEEVIEAFKRYSRVL